MIIIHRNPTEESFIAWISQHPESLHPLDMKRFYVFAHNVNSYRSIRWFDKKYFERQIKLQKPNFNEEYIEYFYERLLICRDYHHSYKTPLWDSSDGPSCEVKIINHEIVKQPIDDIRIYTADRIHKK